MSKFISPGWLWALLIPCALVAAYVVAQFIGHNKFTVRFANAPLLEKIAPKRPGWRRHVIAAATILALACLVLAMARPRAEREVLDERTTIMLAIDVSRSMAAQDVEPSRIRSAQEAARKFVRTLPQGAEVGLISFSGNARVLVPPTDDYAELTRAIDNLQLADGTAIGDAVQLSLQVLKSHGLTKDSTAADGSGSTTTEPGASDNPEDVPVDPGGGTPANSDDKPNAAIVVLSDGTTTMGLPTEQSIPLATQAGVPVWTISYGTANGQIEDRGNLVPVPVDPEPLAQLAEATGGKSFEAKSITELEKVYDQLKAAAKPRVKLEEIGWRWTFVAFLLLAASSVASLWWFNRLS
jgi:Ca-activated chloride channel family protein